MKFVRQNSCKNAAEDSRSDYECQWMLKVISSLMNTPVTVKDTQEPASVDIDDWKNTTLEQQRKTSQDQVAQMWSYLVGNPTTKTDYDIA